MGYNRDTVISKCEEWMKDPDQFYKFRLAANSTGKTTDTNEWYTEIIAQYVLDNPDKYTITKITRQKPYKTKTHNGVTKKETNRKEEMIAKEIFNQKKLDIIGELIDYQTPLKSDSLDTAGKIDLLAYDGHTLQILELKRQDSQESLLRCVLEGYTYLNTVDGDKLKKDFKIPEETEIVARPFVFKGGTQYREWNEERPCLKRLMKKLNSRPLFIEEDPKGCYKVTEK